MNGADTPDAGANRRWLKPARAILLTGAGFTKSFKGYLAGEMWAVILNQPEIQQNDRLRKRLLREVQYEAVYDDVLTSPDFSKEEKHALSTAVSRAYKQLHLVVCREGQMDAAEMLGSVDLPPFVTPRPAKLTPVRPGSGFDGCE